MGSARGGARGTCCGWRTPRPTSSARRRRGFGPSRPQVIPDFGVPKPRPKARAALTVEPALSASLALCPTGCTTGLTVGSTAVWLTWLSCKAVALAKVECCWCRGAAEGHARGRGRRGLAGGGRRRRRCQPQQRRATRRCRGRPGHAGENCVADPHAIPPPRSPVLKRIKFVAKCTCQGLTCRQVLGIRRDTGTGAGHRQQLTDDL